MKFGCGMSVDAAKDIFEIFKNIDVHYAAGLRQNTMASPPHANKTARISKPASKMS